MPDEYLNGVTVKFEKAFKGPDVEVVKEGTGAKGPWKLYEFRGSFKDETGQTKTHKMKSFEAPGAVGTAMMGDIKVSPGIFTDPKTGQTNDYVSYTFFPKATVETPKAEAPKAAPPPATEAVTIPLEVRETAVRALIRKGYDVTMDVVHDIVESADDDKKDKTKALLTPGFTEIWKCAIMSLKIEGNVWPDLLQKARDEYAEAQGMPKDSETEPPKEETPEEQAPEHQPRPVLGDLEDCPF